MKKILVGLVIGVLVLAGCSAAQEDNDTESASNTATNELKDTSIYFERVAGEDQYTNYFETWEQSGGYGKPKDATNFYGMSATDVKNLYTNEKDVQYIFSSSNGHTYKVDMTKVNADYQLGDLEVAAVDGNTLYLMKTEDYTTEEEVTLTTSYGDNPVIIINNPRAMISTLVINGELYFAAYINSGSAGTANIYKISKDGTITDYGTVITFKATEFTLQNSVNIINVSDKIYVQASSKLFEIKDGKMSELDFGMSDSGFIVSNILGSNGNMYGIRAVWNDGYFKDNSQDCLARIYLVEWDSDFNIIAEYDLPNNYGNTYHEFGVDLTYNIYQKDGILYISEYIGMSEYAYVTGTKTGTVFSNHTFNQKTKELKNETQFETTERGRIIQ